MNNAARRRRTRERAVAMARRVAAGETIIAIAAAENLSRARIYQLLRMVQGEPLAPPPPRPRPPPFERAPWSYPDEALVALAREGRAEIAAALADREL